MMGRRRIRFLQTDDSRNNWSVEEFIYGMLDRRQEVFTQSVRNLLVCAVVSLGRMDLIATLQF
jgi:hypothetical protein